MRGMQAKVEVYKLMIKGIKQQPQPAFDFDLSKMVLLCCRHVYVFYY